MSAHLESGVIILWGLEFEEEAEGHLHRIVQFILNQAC
jgi:hypothetical protein